MSYRIPQRLAAPLALLSACLVVSHVQAQRGRGGPAAPALAAKAAAPIDLTGYWVSQVTDDWRWRMVTPPKGDVLYLPVNPEGRRVAEAWDPAKDEAAGEPCKAYGAPGLMHMPGRLHTTWEDDNALKLDADAGTQTRVFHFGAAAAASEPPSWQGYSVAQWEIDGGRGGRGRMGRGGPPQHGSLKVVTTHLRPGYYRRNGVPYGANAVLTEYYTTIKEDDGAEYLIVTNFLEDSQYLNAPYVRSVQFKKQADATGWNPTACSAR